MKVNFRIYFQFSGFEYKVLSPWRKNDYTNAKLLTPCLLTGRRLFAHSAWHPRSDNTRRRQIKGERSNSKSEAISTGL